MFTFNDLLSTKMYRKCEYTLIFIWSCMGVNWLKMHGAEDHRISIVFEVDRDLDSEFVETQPVDTVP